MKILVDICHPAHFHFFKNPIKIMKNAGYEVFIVSRDKEITVKLIENQGWEHIKLCSSATSKSGLLKELIQRNFALYKLVKKLKPDAMIAIGGIFIAQVGFVARVPSVVFYDTENAKLQNLMTYPFASVVSVPDCYESWTPRHTNRYLGFHELSYLGKKYFAPDFSVAQKNGLCRDGDTFLVRVVAWKANHDIGESGWSQELLSSVVKVLAKKGKVIISSEQPLPAELKHFEYQGNPSEIHHVMAFSRMFVGESATMASESVVLGVPAVYAAETSRGYCNQQEKLGLLRNVVDVNLENILNAIDELLLIPMDVYSERWRRMLNSMVDVPRHVVEMVESVAPMETEI